jgi:hypothetical protein
MPSQKTALDIPTIKEKKSDSPKEEMVEVIALKPFGRELTKEEGDELQRSLRARGKDDSIKGMTVMVKPGDDPVFITKKVAKKLQAARAIEIVL